MKYGCHLILLLALSNIPARAEEVFPRICWFDRPPKVQRTDGRDSGYNNESWRRTKAIIFEQSRRPSGPEMYINLRLVGATMGDGKIITIKPISDAELKSEMAKLEPFRHSTNSIEIEETKLGSRKALRAHKATPRYADVYWVRVRPNKVLEVTLRGDNEAALASIRPWLGMLKI